MSRIIFALLAAFAVALAGHALRGSLHGKSHAAASGTPFEQCMAQAKRSYGHGSLPESIKRQFTLDCEASVGR